MNKTQLIKRPLITEKSAKDAAKGTYTFAVSKNANKNQIKSTVATIFGVTVLLVRTSTLPGKTKRVGKYRRPSKGVSIKKAIVQLKPGDKIDLFETKET